MGTPGLTATALVLAVAACAPTAAPPSAGAVRVPEAAAGSGRTDPPAAPAGAADACGAARFSHLVGREPAAARALGLPPRARIIGHGDMVTMDYLADRLNIALGPDGKISRISCG